MAPEYYIENKVRFSDQDYSLMTMLKREGSGLWKGTFQRIRKTLPATCLLFPLRDYLAANVFTGRDIISSTLNGSLTGVIFTLVTQPLKVSIDTQYLIHRKEGLAVDFKS